MRILSLVHGPLVRSELFGDVVRADGHSLEEWSVELGASPPRVLDQYDAFFVFGGHMNVDQESEHPWLRTETSLIAGLVQRSAPLLGVCLGGQLLAKAAGAHVGPSPEREAGFVRVQLTDEADGDPLFGSLPRAFDVFSVHEHAFHVPEGGVELARSRVCSQAFRLGDRAWGIQFHPEVRVEQVAQWLRGNPDFPDAEAILDELRARDDDWQDFGARLCRAFLATVGEETSTPARVREAPTRRRAGSPARRPGPERPSRGDARRRA
jgi:GMP synthase (glutamine-hydrolysing)